MTEQLTFADVPSGAERKSDGMAAADAGTDAWWRQTCDRAIAEAARLGRPFQAFDLTRLYGLPEPRHGNQWGPRFASARKAGLIEPAGWAESDRPTTARSAVRLWRGVSGCT